jgi:hypothetical protein
MSRQMGGRGNGNNAVARGAGFAAAKGAGLIALAVVIGIVLLNVVDDGTVKAGTKTTDKTTATTTAATTDTTGGGATSSPTSDKVPPKTPAELNVIVLNHGAPPGAAGRMSDLLRTKGYTKQIDANDWSGSKQTGNSVMCKAGLDEEAAALATAVGNGTPMATFPEPAPPNSHTADCVVAVGGSAG